MLWKENNYFVDFKIILKTTENNNKKKKFCGLREIQRNRKFSLFLIIKLKPSSFKRKKTTKLYFKFPEIKLLFSF